MQNEAALSIYTDNRPAIYIDHDVAYSPAVYIENSNLYIYNPTTNGNPTFFLGAQAAESLQIKSYYQSQT